MIAAHSHELKADAYMRAALDLMSIGDANGAVGRAFFAMLHSTLALFPGLDTESFPSRVSSASSGGFGAFVERLSAAGLPPDLIVMLERAFNRRLVADLGTSQVALEEASQAIAQMTDYVAKLQLLAPAVSRGKSGSDA